MVSVTSASCYIMSASRCHPRYQSRFSYIRGLSPRNFAELVKVVPIEENTRHPANNWTYTSRSLFNNCKPIVSQIYLKILFINKVVLQILQHFFSNLNLALIQQEGGRGLRYRLSMENHKTIIFPINTGINHLENHVSQSACNDLAI